MEINSYKDLIIWQKGINLAVIVLLFIYEIVEEGKMINAFIKKLDDNKIHIARLLTIA